MVVNVLEIMQVELNDPDDLTCLPAISERLS